MPTHVDVYKISTKCVGSTPAAVIYEELVTALLTIPSCMGDESTCSRRYLYIFFLIKILNLCLWNLFCFGSFHIVQPLYIYVYFSFSKIF